MRHLRELLPRPACRGVAIRDVPTWFEDNQRSKDDDAARDGAAQAKSETILGSMIHEVSDLMRGIIPIPQDSEERSREHAYHTTPTGWERNNSSDSSVDAGPSSDGSSYESGCTSSHTGQPTIGESLGICVAAFVVAWPLTGLVGCTALVTAVRLSLSNRPITCVYSVAWMRLRPFSIWTSADGFGSLCNSSASFSDNGACLPAAPSSPS